jgi:hypothetical protein
MPSTNPNQTIAAEGSNRADVRFADVNGDGRVDYLYVPPITRVTTTR